MLYESYVQLSQGQLCANHLVTTSSLVFAIYKSVRISSHILYGYRLHIHFE